MKINANRVNAAALTIERLMADLKRDSKESKELPLLEKAKSILDEVANKLEVIK